MTIENLVRNAFLDDMKDDWVAVAANGHPIARATTEAAVRQAAPDAAHYVNAAMLQDRVARIDDAQVADENPVSAGLDAVVAQQAPADDVKPAADPAADDKAPTADGSAFDHDHDGKAGGSKPHARKAPAKK